MAGAGFHSRFSLCRVLVQMCKTKAFRELCTPSPDLPQMVSTALKVLGFSPTPTPAGGTLWVSLFFHPMPTPQQIHMDHQAWEIPAPSTWWPQPVVPTKVLPSPRGRESEGGDRAALLLLLPCHPTRTPLLQSGTTEWFHMQKQHLKPMVKVSSHLCYSDMIKSPQNI